MEQHLVPPREACWDLAVAHCQMAEAHHCDCGKGHPQPGPLLDQGELLLEGEDSIHLLVAKTFAAVVRMVVGGGSDWRE